ncbi:MAG TPA: hypothetical protein VGE15_02480 [Sphingobacteriaceae bacterium]
MDILSPDLLELYVHLNKEVSAGKNWLVYNHLEVFQDKTKVQCFRRSRDAARFVTQHSRLMARYTTVKLGPLFKIVVGILLQKMVPPYVNTNDYIILLNYKIMNTKNLEYLKDSLKYFGFGEELNGALEKAIMAQPSEFQLRAGGQHFKNRMEYTLNFKKSNQSEMYFFNSYRATLHNENPEMDRGQTFYISKGSGVTAKEAFNLLEGRSVFKQLVNKEGVKYQAWLNLDYNAPDEHGDFKVRQFNEQYGYDLDKTLGAYPIKELKDPEQKKQLLASLEKGNLQLVHFEREGREGKFYIEARPQYKTINVYDQKLHAVRRQSLQESDSSNGQIARASKESPSANVAESDDGGPKRKEGRKRRLST